MDTSTFGHRNRSGNNKQLKKISKKNECQLGGILKTQVEVEPEDQCLQYVCPYSVDLWFRNPGLDKHM